MIEEGYSSQKEKKIWSFVKLCFVLFLILNTVVLIGAGHRGVQTQFGAVTGHIYQEGLSFKIPLVQGVKGMDIRVQKEEVQASAASQDLQTVSSIVAVNYHLNGDKAANIYQTVGLDYDDKIIAPAIQESVKASTAQFTAEELITKRAEVKDKIKILLVEKIAHRGIVVDDILIVDLDFSAAFNSAIDAKVTAEQKALTAKNKLEQVKYEAEQKVVKATAEAEAIRIKAQAIAQQGGKDYVATQWIEAWKEGGSKVPEIIMGEGGANFLYNLDR